MDLLQVLLLVTLAGICGALAELPTGFSTGGIVVAIIIGVVGAFMGMGIASLLPLSNPYLLPVRVGTITLDLFWGFVGSLLLVLLLEGLRVVLPSSASQRG